MTDRAVTPTHPPTATHQIFYFVHDILLSKSYVVKAKVGATVFHRFLNLTSRMCQICKSKISFEMQLEAKRGGGRIMFLF